MRIPKRKPTHTDLVEPEDAVMSEVGIRTVRGWSLPFAAILGVPMFRDSVKFVWDSILCRASSTPI